MLQAEALGDKAMEILSAGGIKPIPAANVTEAGLTFTVTYTYNDGAATNPYIETFTDQVAIVPSDQTWGTDSHTKYTLDIKPNVINFDVTTIAGFTNDGGLQDDVTVH